MKEFDKWYEKERQRRRGAPMYSADYRTGWRAALELVLGWLDYSAEHKEIKDRIHDELESD